jgi:hypothetical protein
MHLSMLMTAAAWVSPAWSCPYGQSGDAADVHEVVMDETAATHCATDTQLVGASCSYSTGLMARRVLDQGAPFSRVASLTGTLEVLESHVAAPFVVGEEGYRVIANELVQALADGGHLHDRLTLTGKWLEVDGVRYVVLTSFKVVNS